MWILGEGLNGSRRLVRAPPTSTAQKGATEASGRKTKKGTKKGGAGFSREKAQETQKRRSRLGEDSSSKTELNPARPFYSNSHFRLGDREFGWFSAGVVTLEIKTRIPEGQRPVPSQPWATPKVQGPSEIRRGWADTAHTTEGNQRNGEGLESRQQYQGQEYLVGRPGPAHLSVPIFLSLILILSPFMSASCSSVVWAVSAHPRPISSYLRDSILSHF